MRNEIIRLGGSFKFNTKMKFNRKLNRTKRENERLVEKIKGVSLEKVIKRKDSPKMTKKEIKEIYRKSEEVEEGRDVEFDTKEQDFLNYTVRLDLSELQKEIADKLKKE